jgi:hypothetical protein
LTVRALGLAGCLAALGCAFAAPAPAATNEVRPCGKSRGWEVSAGNLPPKFPQTKCSFARTTDSALKEYELAKGELPRRLELTINGQALVCRTRESKTYAETRCEGPRRFVLIYRFR